MNRDSVVETPAREPAAAARCGDLQLQSFENTAYERPNQRWVCGHPCGGCALGPTVKGECQATTECQPRWHNDAWLCNRSPGQGGKCEQGPSADGECCRQISRCVPVLALRNRRGRFVFWCVAALVGSGLLMLSSPWRNEVLAPGPLTQQHAQLLRDKRSERCAECHGAASGGFAEWTLATLLPSQALAPPQSALCLECHKSHLPAATAMLAHAMSVEQLTSLSEQTTARLQRNQAPRMTRAATDPTAEIACASCHREHHGAAFNLSALTNQQCASCHQDSFTQFSQHPAFDGWPYERRTRIAFDHAAHQAKHFPKANSSFDCTACHELGGATGISTVNSFEQACARCHQEDIDNSMATGVRILALPMLNTRVLAANGYDVGQWPAQVSELFDGTIAPMTQLLLGSDRRAWSALNQFGPDFDFLDIDTDNVDDLEAAHDLAWGIKQLIYDLTTDARGAFRRRLEVALQTSLTDQEAAALSAQLPRGLISNVQRAWFPQLLTEVPAYRRKNGLPPNGIESQWRGKSRLVVGDIPVLTKLGSAGGEWRVDHRMFDVSVMPRGHASAFVHSWIELLGRNAQVRMPETAWPLCELLISPTGPGQCVSCHSIEREIGAEAALGQRVNWQGADHWPPTGELVRFSHDPHVLQPGYENCESCHQIQGTANFTQAYQALDPAAFVSEFAPLEQQDCAGCHHPQGAGEGCLKCHDYHVGGSLQPAFHRSL